MWRDPRLTILRDPTVTAVAAVVTTVASTVIGLESASQQASAARNQARREQQALERQTKEDLRVANQQIEDINTEQALADEQLGKDLINISRFSAKEIGAIKAQQGGSGARGLSADLVVAEAEQNKRLDEAAFKRSAEIDRIAREESKKRIREAGKFIQRESLIGQRDILAAGRERAAAARLEGISKAISGVSRLSTIKFPTVSEGRKSKTLERRWV